MIEVIPSIDIIDGECVRLKKGDYNTKKSYGSPEEWAKKFVSNGLTRLHVVDLDGAREGHIVNEAALWDVCQTGAIVDFGGGIRSDDDIKRAFGCGASMVTVGSVAVTNPELFKSWLEQYGPDKIILAADTYDGHVRMEGWKKSAERDFIPFIDQYVLMGVKKVLCTDIQRDGMKVGPSLQLYFDLLETFPGLYVIASGGVADLDDLHALDDISVPAVLVGRAIYDKKISIDDMIEASMRDLQDDDPIFEGLTFP